MQTRCPPLLTLLAVLTIAPLAAQPETPAPIALSDPDGQELVIQELNVRAAVQGVFSLTEMEIVFRNPHGRRMEGRFTAVLPEGATVSRFAKEVNGRLAGTPTHSWSGSTRSRCPSGAA